MPLAPYILFIHLSIAITGYQSKADCEAAAKVFENVGPTYCVPAHPNTTVISLEK